MQRCACKLMYREQIPTMVEILRNPLPARSSVDTIVAISGWAHTRHDLCSSICRRCLGAGAAPVIQAGTVPRLVRRGRCRIQRRAPVLSAKRPDGRATDKLIKLALAETLPGRSMTRLALSDLRGIAQDRSIFTPGCDSASGRLSLSHMGPLATRAIRTQTFLPSLRCTYFRTVCAESEKLSATSSCDFPSRNNARILAMVSVSTRLPLAFLLRRGVIC